MRMEDNCTAISVRLPPPPPPPPSYPKYLSDPLPRPSQSPAKRFWEAFAVALVIYVVACFTFTRTFAHMASRGIRHRDDGHVGVPRPEDGSVLESIGRLDWSSYEPRPGWAPSFPLGAETSFILPVTAQELYLLSRGAYQSGNFKLRQSTERSNDVRVDVRVAYHDERALARASVCRLHKGGNRDGVGIFTPTPGWSLDARDRLVFDVVFTFPAALSPDGPLRIHELTVLTSNFGHEIGDVWQTMLFEHVELDTSNAPVRAEAITLTKGSLTSSNGAITGHFNVSDALSLHTSNAHIQATASLLGTGRDATTLDMRTSNGHITSSVGLVTDGRAGGRFAVKARSSNGAVRLQYEDAPPGSRLVTEARTSNAVASVGLHPTFEGTYEVATSNGQPVVVDTHPADPTGRGRRRVLERSLVGKTVSGRVHWGRELGESTCVVHTSNARASLEI